MFLNETARELAFENGLHSFVVTTEAFGGLLKSGQKLVEAGRVERACGPEHHRGHTIFFRLRRVGWVSVWVQVCG